MNKLFLILSGTSSESGSGESSTSKLTESLKNMVKSPVFYIVIGAIVLLIVTVYLLRRIVKPRNNASIIVVRGGQIHKVINENDNK